MSGEDATVVPRRRRCRLPSAYRAPAALVCTGVTFALIGVVPLAITLGMGEKSTATVVGVGFIGFGTMFVLPGLCWCIIVRHYRSTWWRRDKRPGDDSLQTPALRSDNDAFIPETEDLEEDQYAQPSIPIY